MPVNPGEEDEIDARIGEERGNTWCEARCISETPKALRVVVKGESKPRWIPKSLVGPESEVESPGDCGTLIMPWWFAEKEDWPCPDPRP